MEIYAVNTDSPFLDDRVWIQVLFVADPDPSTSSRICTPRLQDIILAVLVYGFAGLCEWPACVGLFTKSVVWTVDYDTDMVDGSSEYDALLWSETGN